MNRLLTSLEDESARGITTNGNLTLNSPTVSANNYIGNFLPETLKKAAKTDKKDECNIRVELSKILASSDF